MKGYIYITGAGADPGDGEPLTDPVFSGVPSLGACMPNIRRAVERGDWIFVVSAKRPAVQQYVVGGISKADALSLVAQLGHCHICVSPLVATECGLPCAAELKLLSDNHQITLLDADNIPADLYLNLLGTYELGEGETECIALCSVGPHLFCTDDQGDDPGLDGLIFRV